MTIASKQAWRRRIRSVREGWVLTLVTFCIAVPSADAQIRTDGTLGGAATALSGPNFLINQALGRLSGNNLFYSFQTFNVSNGESANFITTTAGLANVISRVTGGNPSQINGLVSLQAANAAPNFFFINPAGVVFGQGARIDVPAGFNVSTANYIKFPDGSFYADPRAVSTLSSAAPEAFGFLGTTRAPITIENGANLQTTSPRADQPISLVAGDIEINGATVHTAGSDIRLVAVGSSVQDVSLSGAPPDALGNLSILNGGVVSSSPAGGSDGGNIWVSAGNATIDGVGSTNVTRIYTETRTGTGHAGDVSVTVNGALSLLNGGTIETETFSPGNAGTITVKAGTLLIDGGDPTLYRGGIANHAVRDTGNAGNIDVTVNGVLSIVNGGEIETGANIGSGNAGTITVKAGTLVIDMGSATGFFTGITNNAFDASSGNAGDINVTVNGTLSILNGGAIETNNFSSGHAGHAGTITVKAGTLLIDGVSNIGFTGIAINSYGRAGTVGDLNVTVDGTLSILNSGQIAAQRLGSGLVGALTVKAGTLIIDGGTSANLFTGFTGISSRALLASSAGSAADINVTVDGTLSARNGGQISATTAGSGNAGTVTVKAGTLVIDGSGGNFTGIASAAVFGTGNAGEVNVTVDGTLSIANAGQISSGTRTRGKAGAVTVRAGTISGNSNGLIDAEANTGSSGQTGTVTVQAREGITLSNGASISIGNDATVSNPGSLTPTLLTVTAPNITLTDGGQITAASSGNVGASNIRVNFGPQLTLSDASISTSANQGNGGSVAISGTGMLVLRNGQITTSVAGQQGNGGDITIQAPTLVMQTGFIQANTAAATANGGNVNIAVDALIPSGGTLFVGGPTPYTFAPGVFGFNVIQAAAPTGVSGTIQISTPVLDIIGSISALPAGFLDSGGLARSPCAIVGGSSLSQVGRGGMPSRAGDLLWIEPIIEVPAMPPAGVPRSGTVVPPYRTAGSNAMSKTNPCWS